MKRGDRRELYCRLRWKNNSTQTADTHAEDKGGNSRVRVCNCVSVSDLDNDGNKRLQGNTVAPPRSQETKVVELNFHHIFRQKFSCGPHGEEMPFFLILFFFFMIAPLSL